MFVCNASILYECFTCILCVKLYAMLTFSVISTCIYIYLCLLSLFLSMLCCSDISSRVDWGLVGGGYSGSPSPFPPDPEAAAAAFSCSARSASIRQSLQQNLWMYWMASWSREVPPPYRGDQPPLLLVSDNENDNTVKTTTLLAPHNKQPLTQNKTTFSFLFFLFLQGKD